VLRHPVAAPQRWHDDPVSSSPGAGTVEHAPQPSRGGRRRSRRRASPATVLGVLLLVLGLGCLGWLGYAYLGTNMIATRAFDDQRADLRSRWQQPAASQPSAPVPPPLPGEATALLRIPSFGPDFEVPVLEGTDLDVLERGVGHYPGTARPGEVGNFALAGHRITHGQPFARLLELGKGDQVVVETRTAVYTYVLDEPPRSLTVRDTDGWVLDPVPGRPGTEPSRALITLTTCQDLVRSADRSVGFGHLESTTNK
jgi:sortase A